MCKESDLPCRRIDEESDSISQWTFLQTERNDPERDALELRDASELRDVSELRDALELWNVAVQAEQAGLSKDGLEA